MRAALAWRFSWLGIRQRSNSVADYAAGGFEHGADRLMLVAC